MSRILVDQIRSNSASSDAITLDGSGNLTIPGNATISGTATGFGGGKILQVVQAFKDDTASLTNTATITDISGLSVTLTPASSSNKFLITGKVSLSWVQYQNHNLFININGSVVGSGAAASTRSVGHGGFGYPNTNNNYLQLQVPIDYLVNASNANAHTIKLQWNAPDTTGDRTIYLNRNQTDPDHPNSGSRYTSTLTVMEVAA